MRIRTFLLGIAMAFCGCGQAMAAQILREYTVTASDFYTLPGSAFDPPAPIETLYGRFVVAYEEGSTFDATTVGLTYWDLNAPFLMPVQFAVGQLDDGTESIKIGTNVSAFGFTVRSGEPGFGLAIINTPTGSHINAAVYSMGYGQLFVARSFSLNAVPEPAAWLSMIVGFGVVGGFMRRSGGLAAKSVTLFV